MHAFASVAARTAYQFVVRLIPDPLQMHAFL